MRPSGVRRPRVVPHGVVSGLQRLDAPTQKSLQQVRDGDSLADDGYQRVDQRLDLDPFPLRERKLPGRARTV